MKRIMLHLGLVLALLAPLGLGGTVYAACGSPSDAKTQVLNGIGQTGSDCTDSGVTSAVSAAVSILSLIVGVAAVVMVMLGGFKYITSGGESSKVANAKSTLLYALVGLAVAALAQFLVHFVLNNANNAAPCQYSIAGHPGISSGDPLCKKP